MTTSAALDASARIIAIAMALWSIELFTIRREFVPPGLFAGTGMGSRGAGLLARNVPAAAAIQFVAAVALAVFGPLSPVGTAALVVLLIVNIAVRYRRGLGGDGAEQMAILILGACALAALPVPDEVRVTAAVCFIAAQSTLSYAVAGVAKVVSPVWRSGRAIPLILATDGHGGPMISAIFRRRPLLGPVACWSVILFECGFVLALFAPPPVLWAALAIGFAFHLGCAVLMGLSDFVWAFPAAYPCVLAAVSLVRGA